ncbi:hypothetical protein BN946_scf184940.g42 [Trametes cinnabarina]|uniref:Uncharacterized protein n=1 Tax=Pycnoporus cinnabarinus TaxID=5643 RepID=A0A060SC15_PYCCI|nr:hypothetical protein BN946_scf184940.g42 [Trametes cinnabarina]
MRNTHTPPPHLTPYFPEYSQDVTDSRRALLDGSISAIVGGRSPLLKAKEEWPRCKTPECNHYLVPYIQISLSSTRTPEEFRQYLSPIDAEGTTLFQLFVCAKVTNGGTCFEEWTGCHMEGESWLVRKVHFAADGRDVEDDAHYNDVRAAMETEDDGEEEVIDIPEQVVSTWKAGPFERDVEDLWCSSDEEEEGDGVHESEGGDEENEDPRAGGVHNPHKTLKLLGYPLTGKYYSTTSPNGMGNCESGNGGPHCNWRCLIQLGTRVDDNPMYSAGNIFLNQCIQHPDSFESAISGTW